MREGGDKIERGYREGRRDKKEVGDTREEQIQRVKVEIREKKIDQKERGDKRQRSRR